MSLGIVQLHLLEVHYGGQSIGDDIVITLDVAGRHHEIRRSLRPGAVTPLRQELLQVIEERDAPSYSLALRVVEEDALFNDVGTNRVELRFDPTQATQRFTADVSVGEAGSLFGRGDVAKFRFVFESRMTKADRYVVGDPNGWLRVRLANEELVSLPESLHVRLEKLDRDREYFKIMEGPHRELSASVTKKRDGMSFLTADDIHSGPAQIRYSVSRKQLNLARWEDIYAVLIRARKGDGRSVGILTVTE